MPKDHANRRVWFETAGAQALVAPPRRIRQSLVDGSSLAAPTEPVSPLEALMGAGGRVNMIIGFGAAGANSSFNRNRFPGRSCCGDEIAN